jgi:hypothetical protein
MFRAVHPIMRPDQAEVIPQPELRANAREEHVVATSKRDLELPPAKCRTESYQPSPFSGWQEVMSPRRRPARKSAKSLMPRPTRGRNMGSALSPDRK